jgi:hypothetical protein
MRDQPQLPITTSFDNLGREPIRFGSRRMIMLLECSSFALRLLPNATVPRQPKAACVAPLMKFVLHLQLAGVETQIRHTCICTQRWFRYCIEIILRAVISCFIISPHQYGLPSSFQATLFLKVSIGDLFPKACDHPNVVLSTDRFHSLVR